MRRASVLASALAVWRIPAAHAAGPLATTDGEVQGTSAQVQELKVGNGQAMLKFAIVNEGGHAFDPDTLSDHDVKKPDYHSISGVYLLDAKNNKKYLVVTDSEGHCLCSRGMQNIAPKATAHLWAKFPAPPGEVQKIGVSIPHFVPMDEVPLSR